MGAWVNAAGPWARSLAQAGGLDVRVNPDGHEAGITEPAQPFLGPMVVDIRRTPGAANYYFHQSHAGQVIFCITPDPPLIGSDRRLVDFQHLGTPVSHDHSPRGHAGVRV